MVQQSTTQASARALDPSRGRGMAGRMRLRPASPPILALIALAAAVALWLRLPSAARDTLWAEDGAYFLGNAERYGFGHLLLPYAGYLQVVPTLIAGVVVHLPVGLWAYGMTAGACLVSGLCAGTVFACAGAIVPNTVARLLLAGVTVLLPLGPRDVFGNPTNIHTVLLWTLFWIVFAQPRARWQTAVLTLAGLLCALSEIQALFLVPLLVWRLVSRDGRRSRWVVAGPLVGTAAQVVATVLAPRAASHASPVPSASIAVGYLLNAIEPLAVPIGEIGRAAASGGLVVAGAAVAVVLAVVVALWRRIGVRPRLALVSALLLGPAIYAASVLVNPAPYYDYASLSRAGLASAWVTRYGVAPGMLFVAVVIVLASLGWTSRRPRIAAVAALVAVAVCLTAFFVPSWTRRSDGPAWAPQIAAAADRCAVDGTRSVLMTETLRWHLRVGCSLLPDDDATDPDVPRAVPG